MHILQTAAEVFRRRRSWGFWRYFAGRRLTEATVEEFGLGCVPEAPVLLEPQANVPGYLAAGLLDKVLWRRQRRLECPFRGMYAFPIGVPGEPPRSFAFRASRKTEGARFLTLPNTREGDTLPGEPWRIERPTFYGAVDPFTVSRVAICEGPVDMLRVHQAGIPGAVCTTGAGTADDAILKLLDNPEREVTLFYDWDRMGLRRSLAIALAASAKGVATNFYVSAPPTGTAGKDPADLPSDQAVLDVFWGCRMPADAFADMLIREAIDPADPWQAHVAQVLKASGGSLSRPLTRKE